MSMICDGGERYLDTYHNDSWLRDNGYDLAPYTAQLRTFYETGVMHSV